VRLSAAASHAPAMLGRAGFVSTCVSLCIGGSLWLLYRYAKRVLLRFRLPADEVITGCFNTVMNTPKSPKHAAAGSTTAHSIDNRNISSLISQGQLHSAAAH